MTLLDRLVAAGVEVRVRNERLATGTIHDFEPEVLAMKAELSLLPISAYGANSESAMTEAADRLVAQCKRILAVVGQSLEGSK